MCDVLIEAEEFGLYKTFDLENVDVICNKMCIRDRATAEFNANMADPQFTEEPGARNSKRLPVKAKGEVRLRSVLSNSSSGICPKPRCKPFLSSTSIASSIELFSNLSKISLICVPRKVEMIAGGASFAPRPVSYTHLDVYKRQGLFFVSSVRICCVRNIW